MPERPAPEQNPDPIVTQSLSAYYLVAALLLVGSLGWALYDEFYGLRPWKSYQQRFVKAYTAWLKKRIPAQAAAQKEIEQSAEYQKLQEEMKAAEQAAAPRVKEIDLAVADINTRLAAVQDVFTTARGKIQALVYEMETSSARSRPARLRQIDGEKKGPFRVGQESFTYDRLEERYNSLREQRAALQAERAELLKAANELRQKRDAYLQEHMPGLTRQQMQGLLGKMNQFKVEIKQIHVAEGNLVDRCESCHVGIREPVTLTRKDMGNERAFTSHPTPELLKIHDPERFGCSPCHNGNGRATTSVLKAHGKYEHWLWPMFDRENVEAGCHQCHASDLALRNAGVINQGKALFRERGCAGCHRFEGFEAESERLFAARQSIRQMEQERAQAERDSARLEKEADQTSNDEEARRLNQKAENLRVSVSGIDARIEQLDLQAKNLMQEIKKLGPSLKEVRVKMRKEWLPVWLENPHAWRPTTKMPRFRLDREDREAISAFIWQSGVSGTLPAQAPGNPERGKELFETRGCLGCHSVGEDSERVGGTFAANLTRVGEKDNYDYLVRWIHNPRERTQPYCPYEKRDIGPEDYAKKGLPFQFDLQHSRCPNDGHQLQVQQMTVMPSLRLDWQEARDIAGYLMTRKKQDPASYPAASFMDDPRLKNRGAFLVRHYGCAGCHEIAGLEEEGRIGTELTAEGSKPIERLDFALLEREAEHKGWYNHKGFFEHKLAQPEVFDQGKQKQPLERLRMPRPNLQPQEIKALTTFLLGAVEPTLPQQFFYRPADQRKDIQEGWWIIKKYNCEGCHVVDVGQRSALMDNPRYQAPEWKEQLPPRLVGEGARVDPQWLVRFLGNPAMSEADTDRNGVRPYLRVRMPTFNFSEGEVRKLVRFFAALSYQPEPYIQVKLEPLTPQEQAMARQLFTSAAAPCLKCHATGDPAHDRGATAPNFLLARERLKPGWTTRWMLDPAKIAPGTSMPSGLFRREGDRWVFSGPTPASFQGYRGDHADLLVRYMFQFTPEEQRRLGKPPAAAGGVPTAGRQPSSAPSGRRGK